MKIFYDHLVLREEITTELDKYELTVEQREDILTVVDQTLHHEVLDVILTSLPTEKHELFLKKFHQNPTDERLLDYLKGQVADIDEQIQNAAKKVKKEILAEIKRAEK